MDKGHFLTEHVKEGSNTEYVLDPVSVIGIVQSLVEIILSFVPKQQAKDLLDAEALRRANAAANADEIANFGKPSQ